MDKKEINSYKEFKSGTGEDKYSWETIVDFTEIKRRGVKLEDILLCLQ